MQAFLYIPEHRDTKLQFWLRNFQSSGKCQKNVAAHLKHVTVKVGSPDFLKRVMEQGLGFEMDESVGGKAYQYVAHYRPCTGWSKTYQARKLFSFICACAAWMEGAGACQI